MKPLAIGTVTLAIAIGAHTAAHAQTIEKKALNLEGAKKVIAAATAEAKSKNAPGGAIAVVDEGGNLIAVERLDNTFAAGANISIGKARTAVLFKRPTKFFEDVINKGRTAMTTLTILRRSKAAFQLSSMGRSSAQSASAAQPRRSKTKSLPSPARMLWRPAPRKQSNFPDRKFERGF